VLRFATLFTFQFDPRHLGKNLVKYFHVQLPPETKYYNHQKLITWYISIIKTYLLVTVFTCWFVLFINFLSIIFSSWLFFPCTISQNHSIDIKSFIPSSINQNYFITIIFEVIFLLDQNELFIDPIVGPLFFYLTHPQHIFHFAV
jgi:hypothetical protein